MRACDEKGVARPREKGIEERDQKRYREPEKGHFHVVEAVARRPRDGEHPRSHRCTSPKMLILTRG